jgi:hypothetical protein
MTSLYGVQSAQSGTRRRELPQDSMHAGGGQDMYAAWKAIFDNAQPARPGPEHMRVEQGSATRVGNVAQPDNPDLEPSQPGTCRLEEAAHDIVRTPETSRAAAARSAGPGVESTTWALAPTPDVSSAGDRESISDVAVRVHYVRSVSAPLNGAVQPEVVSIILDGANVSIIVRDAGLTEGEALRTAFETARELTGKSGSLLQLTLNGRVLYQQANSRDLAPSGDILFAC